MKPVFRTVKKLPDESLTYTNCVYVNRELYENLRSESIMAYATIEGMVFCAKFHELATEKDIFMNSCARELIRVAVGQGVTVSSESNNSGNSRNFDIAAKYPAAHRIEFNVSHFRPQNKDIPLLEFEKLSSQVKKMFNEHVLHYDQSLPLLLDRAQLRLKVSNLYLDSGDEHSFNLAIKARLCSDTELEFGYKTVEGTELKIPKTQSIFKPNFKFEELGIGGLDNEFADIFRRAFASRIYPPELLKELGISHVKGLLLYGPPGTGKTLIARQISKALNCTKLKTVNGPEIMSRFFGQSEENVRNLFLDAETEYARMGDRSGLHIIIFDEIDSICQRRGSDTSGTAARDSIVNQLLSKIDGVDSLNNILLIGMTNRLDMIDEALLRPGRFEVHIEVGLPDENGRQQILKIHTRVMRESKRLSNDVDLNYVVKQTKNYSGAELEGLVKCAVSYAIQRHVDGSDLSKPKNTDQIIVNQNDFNSALLEVKPAYGVDSVNLNTFSRHGIIPFGSKFQEVLETCITLANQVSKSEKTPVLSVLLHGPVGSGKSALAAHVASIASFPFVKVISPESYIGLSELAKVNAIHKAFDDAHKTPQSLIILDNIERLIDYSPIGPRFSNNILQCLLILIKKAPEHQRRIFVIGTTSEEEFMDMANVTQAFTVSTQVPLVTGPNEIIQALSGVTIPNLTFTQEEIYLVANSGKVPEIGIKHLLLALEIAIQKTLELGTNYISSVTFLESLEACGYLHFRRFFGTAASEKIFSEINQNRKINKLVFRGVVVVCMGAGVYVWMRNPNCPIYDGILYGLRKWVDPEDSHKLSILLAKLKLTPVDYSIDPPILYNHIGNIKIFNPIGMAAGYDKNCQVPLEILRLGFGFIEVGTVLPKPQPGNPKPRLFRLPNNKALINCLGFNSLGIDVAVENMKLARARQKNDPLTRDSIIGISIGKNLNGEILSDVSYCIEKIGLYSDYLCINVSSPNTPNLRDNQRKEPLLKLVKTAKKALEDLDKRVTTENLSYVNTTKTKPLLLFKISPDVTDQELKDIAEIALEHHLDGLVLTNTTISRPECLKEELELTGNPRGGLSGNPLKERSRRIVFQMYKLTNGKIPIIACGGISTAQDALEMIEAGASVCQLLTGLVYQGPKLPSVMKKELADLLNKKGYKNIQEAIGSAHEKK